MGIYSFVIAYFFRLYKDKDLAISLSFIAKLMHLVFVLSIIRFITGQSLPRFYDGYMDNKLAMLPIMLLAIYVHNNVVSKKFDGIISSYNNLKTNEFNNILKIILIFSPLLFSIIILTNV